MPARADLVPTRFMLALRDPTAPPVEIIAVSTLSHAMSLLRGSRSERGTYVVDPMSPAEYARLVEANPYPVITKDGETSRVYAEIQEAIDNGETGVLLVGPHGCGKSHVASRVPALLPFIAHKSAILSTVLTQERCGMTPSWRAPFRAPHHTLSAPGGMGEVELACHGVLMLDEVESFPFNTLRTMSGAVTAHTLATRPFVILATTEVGERVQRAQESFGITKVVVMP